MRLRPGRRNAWEKFPQGQNIRCQVRLVVRHRYPASAEFIQESRLRQVRQAGGPAAGQASIQKQTNGKVKEEFAAGTTGLGNQFIWHGQLHGPECSAITATRNPTATRDTFTP